MKNKNALLIMASTIVLIILSIVVMNLKSSNQNPISGKASISKGEITQIPGNNPEGIGADIT